MDGKRSGTREARVEARSWPGRLFRPNWMLFRSARELGDGTAKAPGRRVDGRSTPHPADADASTSSAAECTGPARPGNTRWPHT